MRAPHFAVVLSTLALAAALPRTPEWTPREQQVFEYFPDFRYVDQMENPSFMTARCTSEGVFPHPYNCTWFYRCHDRTGHGFFTTNWFYCEPGTEFDDDLDQCIPKSGTCGGGDDTYFCRTLQSSCRSCNVGASQQQLCEFKECFNGGRDAGIQRMCDQGELFDEQRQSCVEVSGCPQVVASPPGECPLNMARPGAKWTDDNSGCAVYAGCRAGRLYEERLCTSFYDCQEGTKVVRSCPDGYFFNRQWELCVQPPQTDCTPPPPPPPPCIVSQGVGQDCQEYTGCFNGNPVRTNRRLCNYYMCSQTGSQRFYCRGQGSSYSFSPDTNTCISNNVECPAEECLPEKAVRWVSCNFYTGYRFPSAQKISQEQLCGEYSCSQTNGLRPCGPGQLYSPTSRSCVAELSPIAPPPPCTANLATSWERCITAYDCSGAHMEECQVFRCPENGEAYSCQGGQVFSPANLACVNPVSVANCPVPKCTADQAQVWVGCNDATGCSADNQLDRTEYQCQTYQCSITGETFSCQGGLVFSPDQRACVEPLNAASCPCTVDRAKFWGDCRDVTGCSANNTFERTENQCQTYQCSIIGENKSCGGGLVFSPDQRACVEPLNADSCPCTVNRAKFWGDCSDVTGCSASYPFERTENQCQTYQCSITGENMRCNGVLVFSPDAISCVEPLNDASCPCTVDRAKFWGNCADVTGCSANNTFERTENQCQTFQCSITGENEICGEGLVFSPDQRACVEPLNAASCPCTVDQAKFWGDCKDVTGCSANNTSERTENQCQTYQCSFTGESQSCEGGLVFNPAQRDCVEPLDAASCPCTVDRAKFWGDCKDVTGCSANNTSERTENQCQTYQCSITGESQSCEGGLVFNPAQRDCVEPLDDASCPCTLDRAISGGDCAEVTGCTADSQSERTENLCETFLCSLTGEQILCEGGLVYSPDQRACVERITECPLTLEVCTPAQAKKWTTCQSFCDNDGSETEMCYFYSCTENLKDDKVPCNDQYTELFNPTTKTCSPKRTECPRAASSGLRDGCSPNRANLWYDCSTNKACVGDRFPQQKQNLCGEYSCAGEKIKCSNGQMYDSHKSACVTPLTGKNCLEGIPQSQPKVTLKSWSNQWN